MEEKNSRFEEITLSGASCSWISGLAAGDLVWVYPYAYERQDKTLGMVTKRTETNQELMFLYVPVYVFKSKRVMEYEINCVELISNV